jgi:hypothetical protein
MLEVIFTVIALAACFAAWCAGLEAGREQGMEQGRMQGEIDYAAKIKGDDTDHCRFTFGNIKNRED